MLFSANIDQIRKRYVQGGKYLTACLFLICAFLFSFVAIADAAVLKTVDEGGAHQAGDTFYVDVLVDSQGFAINAVSGTLSFPTKLLDIISVQTNNSIVGLWVSDPSFSNLSGTVKFEGIILNPGYTGPGGNIVRVFFRARTAGAGTLRFIDGSVLANDGLGTNVLDSLKTLEVAILPNGPVEEATVQIPKQSVSSVVVPKPVVVSKSHPEEDTWYAEKDFAFEINAPDDVTAVRTLVNQNPESSPAVTYQTRSIDKVVRDLDDGVWYFHVRYQKDGVWGPIVHRTIQVDTTPPEIVSVETVAGKNGLEVVVNAVDAVSGVDKVNIEYDEETFSLNRQLSAGFSVDVNITKETKGTLHVYDKAGNVTKRSIALVPGASVIESQISEPLQNESNNFQLVIIIVLASTVGIGLIALMTWFFVLWRESRRKRIDKEIDELVRYMNIVFKVIENDIEHTQHEILIAGKRKKLKKAEKLAFDRLSASVRDADRQLHKELDDIVQEFRSQKKF